MGYSQWGHKSQTQFSDQTTNTHMCVCMYLSWRRKCTPLQYSCLENPMDRGAWLAAVHGVTKSRMQLTSLSLFIFMHRRKKWQPTPVLLPGESQGRGSLVGCHLWGHTESDTIEVTTAAAAAAYMYRLYSSLSSLISLSL